MGVDVGDDESGFVAQQRGQFVEAVAPGLAGTATSMGKRNG